MYYRHLTRDERYQIQALWLGGFTPSEIARQLRRARSSISRELKRCAGRQYSAAVAHLQAQQCRHMASSAPVIDAATWVRVERRLRGEWSLEQIAGRGEEQVSHERIYQYIVQDKQRDGDLWTFRRRRRRYRHIGTSRQCQRFGGRRITDRPPHVEQRHQVGHWEADGVLGKGAVRIVTLVERKSLYTKIQRAPNGSARQATRAVLAALHALRARVRTLTYDNGSEFAEHELVDIVLEAQSYFADPYSAWQRGTNENTNGLIRQYLPKDHHMNDLTDARIQQIEDKLNSRPRK